MLETRQRFSRIAHCLDLWEGDPPRCKLSITESCFVARQAFGAILACQAALTQTTFRKRLEHVERGDHVEKLSAIL